MPPKPPRVIELDGLRGLLAVWVMLTHVMCWTGCGSGPPGFHWRSWDWGQFISAQPAVETFIILSGFAISFLLAARPTTYPRFLRGRLFRIYPTYLTCLALGVATLGLTPWILSHASWGATPYFRLVGAISVNEQRHPLAHTLSHLTLLHGAIPREVFSFATATILPPAWSITLEWQYYLAAPAIAWLLLSGRRVMVLLGVGTFGWLFADHWENSHLAFMPAHLPLFLVGIGSYQLHAWRHGRPLELRARWGGGAFILATVWVAVAYPIALGIWGVVFGGMLLSEEGKLSWLAWPLRVGLRSRAAQWLGAISYPLYLVHWPLIVSGLGLLLWGWPSVGSGMALLVMLGLGVPLFVAAAWSIHRYVERPGMEFGAALDRGRKGATTVGEAGTGCVPEPEGLVRGQERPSRDEGLLGMGWQG